MATRAKAFFLALLVLAPAPAGAGETRAVDVALVLAVDVSRSITADEYRLQIQGYAAAFRSERIAAAIRGGDNGAIAVALIAWAGPSLQKRAVDWSLVSNNASAAALADRILAVPFAPQRGTAIGSAIAYADRLLAEVPFVALRKVIDVSGDGRSLDPAGLAAARSAAITHGVTINGLPIDTGGDPGIVDYYRAAVADGPGAFVVAANGFPAFGAAVLDKLALEIAGEIPAIRLARR